MAIGEVAPFDPDKHAFQVWNTELKKAELVDPATVSTGGGEGSGSEDVESLEARIAAAEEDLTGKASSGSVAAVAVTAEEAASTAEAAAATATAAQTAVAAATATANAAAASVGGKLDVAATLAQLDTLAGSIGVELFVRPVNTEDPEYVPPVKGSLLASGDPIPATTRLFGVDLVATEQFDATPVVYPGAAETLDPADFGAVIVLLHATPVLTAALEAVEPYGDGYTVRVYGENAWTFDLPAGATLNGVDGGSVAVSAWPHFIDLTRRSADEWDYTGNVAAAGAPAGLGTGDSPQFAGVNLGHASDTTLTRSSAGNVAVKGNVLYRAGGTDVPVADGGTGASDAATARTNLGIVAASTTASGIAELATTAETSAGTDAARAVTPDSLAGSVMGTKEVAIEVFAPTEEHATGDGKAYFMAPASFNGMDLVAVRAMIVTAGTTGTLTVQIHNVTDAVDVLSTRITIDSAESTTATAAAAAVINAANDAIATNDVWRVDVDTVHTTEGFGLVVVLEFRLP